MNDHPVAPAASLPTETPEPRAVTPRRPSRLLVRAYGAWLVVALMLQLAGYADTRAVRDLFTILAEVAVGTLAVIAWRLRARFAAALDESGIRGALRFILAGLIPAYASEVLFYFAITPEMPIGVFLLRTLVWYVGWLAAWHWLRRAHALTAAEVFFLGGFNGFIVEGLILRPVPLTLLGLLLYPLVASLYGVILLVPYAVGEPAPVRERTISGARVFVRSLLPLLAFLPGLAWMALVQAAFGVK